MRSVANSKPYEVWPMEKPYDVEPFQHHMAFRPLENRTMFGPLKNHAIFNPFKTTRCLGRAKTIPLLARWITIRRLACTEPYALCFPLNNYTMLHLFKTIHVLAVQRLFDARPVEKTMRLLARSRPHDVWTVETIRCVCLPSPYGF